MRRDTSWREEARRLHALGHGFNEIARATKTSYKEVRRLFDPAFHQRELEYQRTYYRRVRGEPAPVAASCTIEPWRAKPARRLIDRDAIMPAARAFAAGEIDRAELMRRISA